METKLKLMRESRGLTQRQLSDMAGINFRVLQSYEQGAAKIDGARISTLAGLATALDCGISEIIDDPETVEKIKYTYI